MSVAPANLLAVRSLLLHHLHPSGGVGDHQLDADIVDGEAGPGGYHRGADELGADDYSVADSPRDRAGLSPYASALDVGWFEVRSGGTVHNLRTFSTWCVTQCRADTPDSADIREIIYSPDGSTVRRWDRLDRPTAGTLRPGLPTHFSYFRDATSSGHDLRPLYRRYLADIGLLRPAQPVPEADLQQTDKLLYDTGLTGRTVAHFLADVQNLRNWQWSALGAPGVVNPPQPGSPAQLVLAMAQAFPRVAAQVARLAGDQPPADPALVARLLAG
ncbi:hypothetical protein ACFQ0D_32045, partial [Micromonospora zhanjiangensis]